MKQRTFDPGLGTNYSRRTKRTVNKDGTFNVLRKSSDFTGRNIYQFLVTVSWPVFFTCVFSGYFLTNLFFASIYTFVGVENINGALSNSVEIPFWSAFFFSVQTLTTVGYGGMHPLGILTNSIASVEAMIGLMGIAIATGILYGRFSRPDIKLIYSKNMLMTKVNGKNALIFRLANQRSNPLIDLEVSVMCVLTNTTDFSRQYQNIKLQTSKIDYLPLNWTLVHIIDEESPIFEKTETDLKNMEAEFVINFKAFDETFSQQVKQRYSYEYFEILWNKKFAKVFYTDEEGYIIFELEKMSLTEDLPA